MITILNDELQAIYKLVKNSKKIILQGESRLMEQITSTKENYNYGVNLLEMDVINLEVLFETAKKVSERLVNFGMSFIPPTLIFIDNGEIKAESFIAGKDIYCDKYADWMRFKHRTSRALIMEERHFNFLVTHNKEYAAISEKLDCGELNVNDIPARYRTDNLLINVTEKNRFHKISRAEIVTDKNGRRKINKWNDNFVTNF